ncbi:MAG: LamG domain-containing protein [Mesorhizobium sp.]|uniref:LamG domain-containing protein n=1 Tax=Mesorhizobium sp. TaxID=1871066 RepID=UPI001229DFD1|nr:LamG domain-containing protein [Mesorhizobium sp.]TIW11985.1 MAG: LamG domain-containing protein [Mesorhizobium sp.]
MFFGNWYAMMVLNPFILTPPGGGGDPNFSNVKLLLGFEGEDSATTLTDESSAAHSFTAFGNAQIDTADFKYGTSSGLFDGSGDYWSTPSSSDFRLSAANSDKFTIEGWIHQGAGTTFWNSSIIGRGLSDGNLGWRVLIVDGSLRFSFSPSGTGWTSISTSSFLITSGAWSHFAVDKDAAGKIRLFIDGVMRASDTPADSSFFNTTAALQVGNPQFGGDPMKGWLDEIRVTVGENRYGSDTSFTPPTAAFPRS